MRFFFTTSSIRLALFTVCWMLASVCLSAQTVGRENEDSAMRQVSVFTCSPGTEAYTLFGHTALRVVADGEDWTYNYGVFDYNAGRFIVRFVLGQTDYILAREPSAYFLYRYAMRGFTVSEQVLALTDEETERLKTILENNARPEHRTYRYNFLYDNCTTRARLAVERALRADGRVEYPGIKDAVTQRDILHRFTQVAPWKEFGIDMVLGCEIDRATTDSTRLFVPSAWANELATAELVSKDGTRRKIVASTQTYAPAEEMTDTEGSAPVNPAQTMWTVFAMSALVLLLRRQCHTLSVVWTALLWLIQGLAGCLVALLFFASEHPAVGSNWLVLAFNPIPLAILIEWATRRWRGGRPWLYVQIDCGKITLRGSLLEIVNLTGVLSVIAIAILPIQQVQTSVIPLALSLFLVALSRTMHHNRH